MSMNALSRALREPGGALPVPWGTLADKLKIPRGTFMLGLAAPGVGKSVFALNWAIALGSQYGEPVLYVTPDTDLATQGRRAFAALERRELDTVAPEAAAQYFQDHSLSIRWCDELNNPLELAELIEAETEYLGRPPTMTIVDVVDDLVEKEGYEEYKSTFKVLRRIARKYKTVVFALHHISRGDMAKGTVPVALHAGTYTGEQIAEVVLGFWRTHERQYGGAAYGDYQPFSIGILKNRNGPANPAPTGPDVTLPAWMERAEIGGRGG